MIHTLGYETFTFSSSYKLGNQWVNEGEKDNKDTVVLTMVSLPLTQMLWLSCWQVSDLC